MVTRLRHVPPLAYVFLAFSFIGAGVELTYHFLAPATIPVYGQWLAGLSAVDRDFFWLAYELIAHVCIAVGLMGLVVVVLYQHLNQAEAKS
jgi:hypothetical protein